MSELLIYYFNWLKLQINFDNSWKAFLGEFTLQLLPEQCLIENFSEKSFTLMSPKLSNQFLIYVHSGCENIEKKERGLNEPVSICDKGIQVESSFSSEMLEDLEWLQKKKRIKLYQKPEENNIIKVSIYVVSCKSLLHWIPHFEINLEGSPIEPAISISLLSVKVHFTGGIQ